MSVSLGLASDKVVRGLSQTDGQASLMLDLGWRSAGGWSVGASTATLHDHSVTESVLSLAWQRQLDANWQVQTGLAYYAYLGSGQRPPPYNELFATLAWDGRATLLLGASPDTRLGDNRASMPPNQTRHAELTWHQRLVGRLGLDLGVGHIAYSRLPSYHYGSVGLGWSTGPVQLFLTRVDSNAAQRGVVPAATAGPRWVGSVLWAF